MFVSVMQVAICAFGTLLFALAARRKLRSPEEFGAALANYQLLPGGWTGVMAFALPGAELLVASAMLSSPGRTIGLWSASALSVTFAVAIAINIRRGRSDIDCGCGAPAGPRSPLHWGLVIRSLVLAAVFLWCAVAPARPLSWSAVAVGALAGVNAYLLYAGYEAVAVIASHPHPKLSAAMRELAWRHHPGLHT